MFKDFKISAKANEEILQRSVHHQIENAYFEAKLDSLSTVIASKNENLYPGDSQFYLLDNYTRFESLEETFVEIIAFARIRKNENDQPEFRVNTVSNSLDYNLPPLLLVDNVLVKDHSHFMNYPSEKIESIEVFRNNFYLGPIVAQGIIKVETLKGDYVETLEDLTEIRIESPKPAKNYTFQTYSEPDKFERIPDFRYQLFWQPNIELQDLEKEIEFYTSDVIGTFQISIEGFTENGDPVSLKEEFKVE